MECSVGVSGWVTGVSSYILDGYTWIIVCVFSDLWKAFARCGHYDWI